MGVGEDVTHACVANGEPGSLSVNPSPAGCSPDAQRGSSNAKEREAILLETWALLENQQEG